MQPRRMVWRTKWTNVDSNRLPMYVFRLLFVIRIFEFSVLTVALIVDPGNFRLDYEELAVTNFSYSVRVFQRLLGCQACNAEAMAMVMF